MTKRIVVIDDSPMILSLTKKALEAVGYEAVTMEDPSGFDPIAEPPDLILVDVNMPQFFGDDVVSFFRTEFDVPVPIYLYSTVAEDELARRAKECGAQGYISKDWGLEAMLDAVQKILGRGGETA